MHLLLCVNGAVDNNTNESLPWQETADIYKIMNDAGRSISFHGRYFDHRAFCFHLRADALR